MDAVDNNFVETCVHKLSRNPLVDPIIISLITTSPSFPENVRRRKHQRRFDGHTQPRFTGVLYVGSLNEILDVFVRTSTNSSEASCKRKFSTQLIDISLVPQGKRNNGLQFVNRGPRGCKCTEHTQSQETLLFALSVRA